MIVIAFHLISDEDVRIYKLIIFDSGGRPWRSFRVFAAVITLKATSPDDLVTDRVGKVVLLLPHS
jgi:hypothetical protein